jgi:hypothetical protein
MLAALAGLLILLAGLLLAAALLLTGLLTRVLILLTGGGLRVGHRDLPWWTSLLERQRK